MRTLPNIAGTVVNCPLNGSLVDVSGNSLTPTIHRGSALYETFDACSQAFTFDGANGDTSLLFPLTPLLQFVGEMTIQFITLPRSDLTQTMFEAQTPGGANLYAFYINTPSLVSYADQHVNNNLGFPSTSIAWGPYVTAAVPMSVAFRRRLTSAGHWLAECFINGVLSGSSLATTPANVAAGTEQLGVGDQIAGSTPYKGAMANLRILNYARADADITADSAYTMGSCLPTSGLFTVSDSSRFTVGGVYQTQLGGVIDLGTVTVTAINPLTNQITGTYNGSWVPQVGHIFELVPDGQGISLEMVSFSLGIEPKGLNRLPIKQRF